MNTWETYKENLLRKSWLDPEPVIDYEADLREAKLVEELDLNEEIRGILDSFSNS